MSFYQKTYPNYMEKGVDEYTSYLAIKKLDKKELKKIVRLAQTKELPLFTEIHRFTKDFFEAKTEVAMEERENLFPTDEPYDREQEKKILKRFK